MEVQKSKRSIARANNLLDVVSFLLTLETRAERNEILGNEECRKSLFPEAELDRFQQFRSNELHHIQHVRRSCTQLFPDVECNHDYTKDEFYMFMTIVAFDFKLKDQLPQDSWQAELDRHLGTEPHHPEYEKLNLEKGLRITDSDIAEMTVDRLSRNLQFNGGSYNDESIVKYEPKFVYDEQRRLQLYRKNVAEFKDMVKRVWDEMKQNP